MQLGIAISKSLLYNRLAIVQHKKGDQLMEYKLIAVRLKQSEVERLDSLARAHGYRPSSYLRMLLSKTRMPPQERDKSTVKPAYYRGA